MMGDIRSVLRYMRSRWDWNAGGYERELPGRCGFGDIDAACEIGGRILFVECKHQDDETQPPTMQSVSIGQRRLLEQLAQPWRNQAAIILFGDAETNNPYGAIEIHGATHDWRHLPIDERRTALRDLYHQLLGIHPATRPVREHPKARDVRTKRATA